MNRTSFPVLLFLAFLAWSGDALAAPKIQVVSEEATTGKKVEVTATEASSPAELRNAVEWIQRDLEQTLAKNPAIKPEVIVAEPGPDGVPSTQEATEEFKRGSLQQKLARFLNDHYRVTFTLIRGAANAGVVAWGLIISSHVSLEAALPVGLVAGGMSAGFQYYNSRYQDWLLRSKGPTGRLGRNFLVNIGYMGIAKLTAAATGIPNNASLLVTAGVVLKTAFLGTLAQGTWGLGVAEAARMNTERYPQHARRIALLNDFKTLAISMISTAISVASLVGAPLTDAAMIVMTGSGAIYYSLTFLKAKRWSRDKAAQEAKIAACEKLAS